jgi:hypothetical protein
MSESFEPNGEARGFASRHSDPDRLAGPNPPTAISPIETFTEREYESLAGRSHLGVGLAQITSRLVQKLATGEDGAPYGSVASACRALRGTTGSRMPSDDTPLVIWNRVIAVSATGSLLALVSVPGQFETPSPAVRSAPG